jgi:hypothetical protein
MICNRATHLMEYRVMGGINRISPVHVPSQQEVRVAFPKLLGLVRARVAPEDRFFVHIVCVVVAAADVVGRHQNLVKILRYIEMKSGPERSSLVTQMVAHHHAPGRLKCNHHPDTTDATFYRCCASHM